MMILDIYCKLAEDLLAMPVIPGEKSPGERFPGAENTYTFEAMMQDCKALQCGTSHYLGQNFSKSFGIRFSNREEKLEHAYTTSWGTTTRLIGGMIMMHGDDDGLRLPPRIAPKQVVILPVIPKEELKEEVLAYAEELAESIRKESYAGEAVSVHVDSRDIRGGVKKWEWVKKGVPIRIEVGPRDIEKSAAMLFRRDNNEKESLSRTEIPVRIPSLLTEIQESYFNQALKWREENTHHNIQTFDEMKKFFSLKKSGFVLGKWCGCEETEDLLSELKVTIRCIPFEQSGTKGKCLITGKDATQDVIYAKSY